MPLLVALLQLNALLPILVQHLAVLALASCVIAQLAHRLRYWVTASALGHDPGSTA